MSLLVVVKNRKGDSVEAENVFEKNMNVVLMKLDDVTPNVEKKDARYYVDLVMQHVDEYLVTLIQHARSDLVESNKTWFVVV